MNLYELYDYAVDQGIDVDWYTMPFAKSFSIFIPSLDRRAIALDPWKFETIADEFTPWATSRSLYDLQLL